MQTKLIETMSDQSSKAQIDPKKTPKFVTHTTERSIGGAFFAVVMWWNPDLGGFWEPWDTGIGRYSRVEHAAEEAKALAEEFNLPYIEPKA